MRVPSTLKSPKIVTLFWNVPLLAAMSVTLIFPVTVAFPYTVAPESVVANFLEPAVYKDAPTLSSKIAISLSELKPSRDIAPPSPLRIVMSPWFTVFLRNTVSLLVVSSASSKAIGWFTGTWIPRWNTSCILVLARSESATVITPEELL